MKYPQLINLEGTQKFAFGSTHVSCKET